MFHDGRESWTDTLFCGVTLATVVLAIVVLAITMAGVLYFNLWIPPGH